MRVRRLLAVTAAVAENADRGVATDIYQLAQQLQAQFPALNYAELVMLIEHAVVEIGGAAYWLRAQTEDA